MTTEGAVEFETQRARLFQLAYRLLGSATDAEDVVQDAFLRWADADRAAIMVPSAWLAKVVTNLCLNRLTSARARRERYVGPWLPEPVLTADGTLGPLDAVEARDSVSFALLVLLERLTPSERAVYVLREAFGYNHREIAEILECSEANSRQLHHRAARHLEKPRSVLSPDRDQWQRLVERFLAAAREGDLPGLERLLAADVTSWADGGGKAPAARRPVAGRDRVARLFAGLFGKYGAGVDISVSEVNGEPAVLGHRNGNLVAVMVLEIADGQIAAMRSVANPDKLVFLARQTANVSHSEGLSGLSG